MNATSNGFGGAVGHESLDGLFVVISAFIVFTMQTGFSLFEAGNYTPLVTSGFSLTAGLSGSETLEILFSAFVFIWSDFFRIALPLRHFYVP